VLEITATLKESGESKTITLNAPPEGEDAEVVFANIHEVFDDSSRDLHRATPGNPHVPVFQNLNPSIDGTVVSNDGVGAEQAKTGNAMMNRFKEIGYTCGDTPPCCFA
jgi:hypothetical protein